MDLLNLGIAVIRGRRPVGIGIAVTGNTGANDGVPGGSTGSSAAAPPRWHTRRCTAFIGYGIYDSTGTIFQDQSITVVIQRRNRTVEVGIVPIQIVKPGTVGLDEAKIRKYIQNQEIKEQIEDKYDGDLSDPF